MTREVGRCVVVVLGEGLGKHPATQNRSDKRGVDDRNLGKYEVYVIFLDHNCLFDSEDTLLRGLTLHEKTHVFLVD